MFWEGSSWLVGPWPPIHGVILSGVELVWYCICRLSAQMEIAVLISHGLTVPEKILEVSISLRFSVSATVRWENKTMYCVVTVHACAIWKDFHVREGPSFSLNAHSQLSTTLDPFYTRLRYSSIRRRHFCYYVSGVQSRWKWGAFVLWDIIRFSSYMFVLWCDYSISVRQYGMVK